MRQVPPWRVDHTSVDTHDKWFSHILRDAGTADPRSVGRAAARTTLPVVAARIPGRPAALFEGSPVVDRGLVVVSSSVPDQHLKAL